MSEVRVFTTPSCPYCHMLKSFLQENNVSFRDIDVSQDRDGAIEMITKTGQRGVPVAEINGNWVVGFDQSRIKQLLSM